MDEQRVVAGAKSSKALACLDQAPAAFRYPQADVPPEVIGAMAEAHAAHQRDDVGDDEILAMDVHAFDSARRLALAAHAAGIGDPGILQALDPAAHPSSSNIGAIVYFCEAGRLEECASAFDSARSHGELTAADTVWGQIRVLAATGRFEDAQRLLQQQTAQAQLANAKELVRGVLLSKRPRDHLATAVADMKRIATASLDVQDAPVAVAVAASLLRWAGYARFAQPLRWWLLDRVSTANRIERGTLLVKFVAPEVDAFGDRDELARVRAIGAGLGPMFQSELAWVSAYERGSLQEALELASRDPDADDRKIELYALWARAATEGFDPRIMASLDSVACGSASGSGE